MKNMKRIIYTANNNMKKNLVTKKFLYSSGIINNFSNCCINAYPWICRSVGNDIGIMNFVIEVVPVLNLT